MELQIGWLQMTGSVVKSHDVLNSWLSIFKKDTPRLLLKYIGDAGLHFQSLAVVLCQDNPI